MLSLTAKTKTTTVNAAFLQEVKESNTQLWSLLRELRNMQTGQGDAREASLRLVDLLGQLRESVALQISLEETYGFIDGGLGKVSGCVPDASMAKLQHRELYLQIQELCEQVEEAQYRGTISRDLSLYLQGFAEFDEAFTAHEELESELILHSLGFGYSR